MSQESKTSFVSTSASEPCEAFADQHSNMLTWVPIDQIKPHPDNPRKHPRKQLVQLKKSIQAFGFRFPVLLDQHSRFICGHARVEAARQLKMQQVPVIRADDLTEEQVRGLMIADNRLTEISQWDDQLLGENLKILYDMELNFEIDSIGFDYGEIEFRVEALSPHQEVSEPTEVQGNIEEQSDEDKDIPSDQAPPVTQPCDLWLLGKHRLLCADAMQLDSYKQLMEDTQAAMILTDPPYNLPARDIGHVCEAAHGDFAMGSSEMSSEQFIMFLGTVMGHLCQFSESGSIHYLFMDRRHAPELLHAGIQHYTAFKNLCVWVKDRPGMGTFYRSQHELVFVFKHGDASHRNHFELGQHGRLRTNVWNYPSIRNGHDEGDDPNRDGVLKLHPTIKPVSLLADAIRDCSRKDEIILDPFLGSGSTLIACEKMHRTCHGIELSPRYMDVAIHRWQQWTGEQAIHMATGKTYDEMQDLREEELSDGVKR